MADERAHPKGRDSLLKMFEKMKVQVETVDPVQFNPTGILSLDIALHGGLPRGRMVLWYGNKGTGKSTTLMLIARELIRQGQRVLWFDFERSLEKRYADLLGLDLSMMDVVKPTTLEQYWDLQMMALDSKAYDMIVTDTLAKASPSTELAASAGKQHMGLGPRVNSQALRMWGGALEASNTTCIILNQERTSLSTYGSPNVNPGGKALEHESSLTLYMGSQGKPVWENGMTKELIFRYTILKSKVFPPPQPYEYFELRVGTSPEAYEISYGYELFMGAKVYGLMQDKDGGRWQKLVAFYDGEKLGNGEAQLMEWFDTPSPLRDKIEAEIIARIQNGVTASPIAQEVQPSDEGSTGPTEQEAAEYLDLLGNSEG